MLGSGAVSTATKDEARVHSLCSQLGDASARSILDAGAWRTIYSTASSSLAVRHT